jgi:hypothetical protein
MDTATIIDSVSYADISDYFFLVIICGWSVQRGRDSVPKEVQLAGPPFPSLELHNNIYLQIRYEKQENKYTGSSNGGYCGHNNNAGDGKLRFLVPAI